MYLYLPRQPSRRTCALAAATSWYRGHVMERRLFVLGLVVPVLAACAAKTPAPGLPSRYVQRGFASWYGHGDGYHGELTASGERFDKNRLTAAHYDLPFGTRVRVRNSMNNRQVDLRINDRIPVETVNKGRILDVSYAAAKRLRMVGDGVVPVEITVRAWPPRALVKTQPGLAPLF